MITENDLVDKIHETGTKCVIFCTGGGSSIFPMLLNRGNGSKTLISGVIPYDSEETYALLGRKPTRLVSKEVALNLATAAYERAVKLVPEGTPVLGLGCTVSLQKVPRERMGRGHVIYVACHSKERTVVHSVEINSEMARELAQQDHKDYADALVIREAEELLTARILLNLLAQGCGIKTDFSYNVDWINVDVQNNDFNTLSPTPESPTSLLISRNLHPIHPIRIAGERLLMLSSSFNPMHSGHAEIAKIAEEATNLICDYELSVVNCDKPTLDYISIRDRINSIRETMHQSNARVWLTRAPRFVDKAKLFPNTTFCIGYDTAVRLTMEKYSKPGETVLDIIDTLKQYGARFLVFPRSEQEYTVKTYKFLCEFEEISTIVEKSRIYDHLSSTKLRNGLL